MNNLEGIIDCYRYIEGQEKPKYWVDWHNCLYYTMKEEDEFGLINGKKYWIIININGKPIVDDATNVEDIDKVWDFKNNCIKL